MSIPEDRFREMKKAMDAQSNDQPVEIAPNGEIRVAGGTTPGQSVVLRDPNGEYGDPATPGDRR